MDLVVCNHEVQAETLRQVRSETGREVPTKQTPTTQEDSELLSHDNRGRKFHLEVFPKPPSPCRRIVGEGLEGGEHSSALRMKRNVIG